MTKKFYGFLFLLLFLFQTAESQAQMKGDDWKSNDTALKFENHLERPSLFLKSGTAIIKNSRFENGIIEVDMAAEGRGGFAGIVFRTQSNEDLEVVYLRLTKSGFNDAVQYTPRFYDVDCWQLYARGYTAAANFEAQKWTHLKIEVENRTAKIFVNNAATPNLVVNDLKRDEGSGEVGVWALGTTYFSNFNYTSRPLTTNLEKSKVELPVGTINSWEVSQALPFDNSTFETYPTAEQVSRLSWEKLHAETNGLVNFSRSRRKVRVDNISFNHSTDVVFAKTKINLSKDQLKKMLFGYSDRTAIFLNGKIIFSGNSAFLSRDGQFLGAIGLHDSLFLDLKKGENELLFVVAEKTGGWGLQAQFIDMDGIELK